MEHVLFENKYGKFSLGFWDNRVDYIGNDIGTGMGFLAIPISVLIFWMFNIHQRAFTLMKFDCKCYIRLPLPSVISWMSQTLKW